MYRLLYRIVILLTVLVALPVLYAQEVTSMNGLITDSSGAVVPNAKVTLLNPSTGVRYTTATNSAGSYRIASIPPGPGYRVTFSAAGFQELSITDLYLNVANPRTQNATLHVGATADQIEVSGSSSNVTINTEDASIGNNFEVQMLNQLPVQSRNSPATLFTLQPGITLNGATTGARVDQTNATVDGLDVNDYGTGNFQAITAGAPVDSIQEFRGTTAGFTTNSGLGGGGQFQLVTKSGSNSWHGNLNFYHQDSATRANNWFNNNAVPAVPKPKLVQNQFGGNVGGPIIHDRAFFFFNYNNSRIAQGSSQSRTVPLPSLLAGNVSYINNGAGCSRSSRQNSQPNCISQLTPDQVRSTDPAHIGNSPALFALLKSSYPAVNDVTGGDGVNTGFFRFNAPLTNFLTNYSGKIDYNLTSKIRFSGIGRVQRQDSVNTVQQFPGAPPTVNQVDRGYSYVGNINWQISDRKTNQISYGTTVQNLVFARPSNPQGVNQLTFSTGTTTLLDDPYSTPSNAQGRRVPISQVVDDFAWNLGRHSVTFGGAFKWIRPHTFTTLDYNSYAIGLGGRISGLGRSLEPADILPGSSTATVTFDSAYAAALGRVGSTSSTFNYNAAGSVIPQGSGSQRNYKYYQTQFYLGDSWKVTPHLTLSYGLNYQIFSVPYELNGLQTVQNLGFNDIFNARVQQSAAGNTAPNAVPFVTYVLGGKANNGPAYYSPSYKDLAPRFAFAYSPGSDPKTVFNGGAGIVYDRTVISAVQNFQDHSTYLFAQSAKQNFGTGSSVAAALADVAHNPRLDAPPGVVAPATPKPPFTPYVTAGIPHGLPDGQFSTMIDPHLRTPYSINMNFGMQHEFPGSLILKVSYAGRLGRRLLAQADSSQLLDFPDIASGQTMGQAMASVTTQMRAGATAATVTPQPWFENQLPAGYKRGYSSNTAYLIDNNLSSLVLLGDFADTIQGLAQDSQFPFAGYNIGMGSQFGSNTVYTNKGFSSYSGLLISLQKNLTHGLQFDFNYTWAHSIDNVSLIANGQASTGYGFICDVARPRLCRGNSDFDVTHLITSDFIYSLPFGRGRTFGGGIPRVLNEIVGGWDISGITTWRSGVAWSTQSSAYVAGFSNNAPGVFNGDTFAIRRSIHKSSGGQLNLFADPDAAVSAFQGPIGFQIGSRNSLRGPQFFNLDTGLAKTFSIWPERNLDLKFRADAFNVLNHPNFNAPATGSSQNDISQGTTFGQLVSINGNNRILQLGARFEF